MLDDTTALLLLILAFVIVFVLFTLLIVFLDRAQKKRESEKQLNRLHTSVYKQEDVMPSPVAVTIDNQLELELVEQHEFDTAVFTVAVDRTLLEDRDNQTNLMSGEVHEKEQVVAYSPVQTEGKLISVTPETPVALQPPTYSIEQQEPDDEDAIEDQSTVIQSYMRTFIRLKHYAFVVSRMRPISTTATGVIPRRMMRILLVAASRIKATCKRAIVTSRLTDLSQYYQSLTIAQSVIRVRVNQDQYGTTISKLQNAVKNAQHLFNAKAITELQSVSRRVSIDADGLRKLQLVISNAAKGDASNRSMSIAPVQSAGRRYIREHAYRYRKHCVMRLASGARSKVIQDNHLCYCEDIQSLQSVFRGLLEPKVITEDISAQATLEHLTIQALMKTAIEEKQLRSSHAQNIKIQAVASIDHEDLSASRHQIIRLQSILRETRAATSLTSSLSLINLISATVTHHTEIMQKRLNATHVLSIQGSVRSVPHIKQMNKNLILVKRIQATSRKKKTQIERVNSLSAVAKQNLEKDQKLTLLKYAIQLQSNFERTECMHELQERIDSHFIHQASVRTAIENTAIIASSRDSLLLQAAIRSIDSGELLAKNFIATTSVQASVRSLLKHLQLKHDLSTSQIINDSVRTAHDCAKKSKNERDVKRIEAVVTFAHTLPSYIQLAIVTSLQADIRLASCEQALRIAQSVVSIQASARSNKDVNNLFVPVIMTDAVVRKSHQVNSHNLLIERTKLLQSTLRRAEAEDTLKEYGYLTWKTQDLIANRLLAYSLEYQQFSNIVIQSNLRSFSTIARDIQRKALCATIQARIRYIPVNQSYNKHREEVNTVLVKLQAAINGKINSDDSLTLVKRRDDGEIERISTAAVLDNIFYPRVDKIRLHAATGITDSIEFGSDVAKKLIEKCIANKEQSLDLSGVNLRILPRELMNCKHVRKLNLSKNDITIVPAWFGDVFKSVEELDLSHNKLFELPQSFEEMDRLKTLDLSHNKFEYFPQIIAYMNIEKLVISHNCMLLIQSDFMMDNLVHLDVSHNYLLRLPEAIADMKQLKSLNIEHNRFLQSEFSNISKIYTPYLGSDRTVKDFIHSLREADEIGYSSTTEKGGDEDNPNLSDVDEYSDTSDVTELVETEIEYDSDYDSESEFSESPSRSRSSHNLNLDLKGIPHVEGDDLDTDRSFISSTSFRATTPKHDKFASPFDASEDLFSSFSFRKANSFMLSPRASATKLKGRFGTRVFGYDRKPELSPVHTTLMNSESRLKLKEYCDVERIVSYDLFCWEAIWYFKYEDGDIKSKKTKAAEIFVTYLETDAPRKVEIPTSLQEILHIQLEDEVTRFRSHTPQTDLDPLPMYVFDSVLAILQDSMQELWGRFKEVHPDEETNGAGAPSKLDVSINSPFSPLTPNMKSPLSTPGSQPYEHIVFDKVDETTILTLENLATKSIDFRERIAVLFEILESERKYVKFLQKLWDLYYMAIVNNQNTGEKAGFFRKRLVSERSAKKMLPSNLRTMIAFNLQFLRKLEERFSIYDKKDPISIYFMRVSDLFIKITPLLDVYVSYVSMYENSMIEIKKYKHKHTSFDVWLTKRKKMRESAGLDFPSLLIMPVQRLNRYRILLQNLLRHTPRDHPDYDSLVKAAEIFSECTLLQHDKIKETNNSIKVQQIGRMLKIEDLAQPNRSLIREGKCSMNNMKQKAYLFNDIIVLREKKRFMEKLLPTVRTFSLSGATLSSGEQDNSVIMEMNALHTDEVEHRTVVLKFDSAEIMLAWLKDLTAAIEKVEQESNSKEVKLVQSQTITNKLRRSVSLSKMSRRFSFSETPTNLSPMSKQVE